MPISEALKKSARSFCGKYVCSFSFKAFESRIEEFTFLRPNGESVKVAYETFSGHRRVNANLTQSLMLAEKERDRERKMNNAMVESLRSGSAGV